jgi:hypothetical protein
MDALDLDHLDRLSQRLVLLAVYDRVAGRLAGAA